MANTRLENWRAAFPGLFRAGGAAADAVSMARDQLLGLGGLAASALDQKRRDLAAEKAKAEGIVDAYVPVGNVRQAIGGVAPTLVGAEALVDAALGRVGGGGGKAADQPGKRSSAQIAGRAAPAVPDYEEDVTIVPAVPDYEEDVTIVPAEAPQPLPDRSISPRGNRVVYDNNGIPIEVDAAGNPITSTADRQQMTVDGNVYNAATGAARVPDAAVVDKSGAPVPNMVAAFGRNIRRISPEAALASGGYRGPQGQLIGGGNVSMMEVSPDSPMGQRLAAEELERSTRELLMRGQRAMAERYLEDPYAEARAKAGYEAQQKAAEQAGAIAAEEAKQEAMAAREISVLEFMFKSAAADIERRAQADIAAIQNDPRPIPQDERARAIDNVRRRAERELEDRKASIMSRGRIGPEDIATARSMNATAGQ